MMRCSYATPKVLMKTRRLHRDKTWVSIMDNMCRAKFTGGRVHLHEASLNNTACVQHIADGVQMVFLQHLLQFFSVHIH